MTARSAPAGLTLDAGALIAVDRGDERVRALLRSARRAGLPLAVPAGALAQAWRGGTGRPGWLASWVRDGTAPLLVALDGPLARAAGALCARTATRDVIDASVLLCARARRHHIVTSDPSDLTRLDPAAPLIAL